MEKRSSMQVVRTCSAAIASFKGTEEPTITDLEAQIPRRLSRRELEVSRVLGAEQLQYLELVFGQPEATLKRHPGLYPYCQYVEESFRPLLDDDYAPMWDALGLQRPSTTQGCWQLPVAVFKSLKLATTQPQDVSIDTILDALPPDRGAGRLRNRASAQMAVFAVVCWATMILTPNLRPPSPLLACMLPGRHLSDAATQHKLDRCKRPISVTFQGFKAQAWGRDVMKAAPVAADGNEDLYEASLNMRSLKLFGKVRIQWVTNMAAHLDFDAASRVLSLYQFPTLCALKSLPNNDKACPVLKSISDAFDPLPTEDTIHRYITLEQEILLSYRLLFAQSTASRKVAQRELAALKQDNKSFDPFLSVLCERKYKRGILWWSKVDQDLAELPPTAWPVSCLDSDDMTLLQERDVYSATEDFPRLGQRLLRVQRFNARWRPSRLTDFWRDRRNPYQWYTFWAVLIVGGVANLLAVLQLAAAIYQATPATAAGGG